VGVESSQRPPEKEKEKYQMNNSSFSETLDDYKAAGTGSGLAIG